MTVTPGTDPREAATCTCGAPSDGKWANIHSPDCPVDDMEATILAVCVRRGVNLHPSVAREIVARLREQGLKP